MSNLCANFRSYERIPLKEFVLRIRLDARLQNWSMSDSGVVNYNRRAFTRSNATTTDHHFNTSFTTSFDNSSFVTVKDCLARNVLACGSSSRSKSFIKLHLLPKLLNTVKIKFDFGVGGASKL